MVHFKMFLFISLLLCTFSIWVSYGIQQEDVAIVRTNLLLRCLIVDSEPFQDILHSCFNYLTSPSQQRFVLLSSGSVRYLSYILGYRVLIDCFE
jgi:hypothetical protein